MSLETLTPPIAQKTAFKDKSHLLPNFNIEREVQGLFRIAGSDSLEGALSEVRGNIIGFKLEFYLQAALLPNPVRLNRHGDIENALSGQRILDMITKRERLGGVYDGFATVEAYLAEAQPGSMAVIASPSGWSGLQDSYGRDYNYHDSQVYTFRVREDGELEAFTLVTDMDFDQNLNLLEKLGVETKGILKPKTYRERLAETVKTPSLIPPGQLEGFEQVAGILQEVIGSDVIRTVTNPDGSKTQKYFADVYKDLQRGDELLKLDARCEEIVGEFETFVREILTLQSPEVARGAIEIKLRDTLVDIYTTVKGEKIPTYKTQSEREFFYLAQSKQIAMLPGCSGGWTSSNIGIDTGLGIRGASTESSNVSYNKGDCVKCKREDVEVGPCKLCRSCG